MRCRKEGSLNERYAEYMSLGQVAVRHFKLGETQVSSFCKKVKDMQGQRSFKGVPGGWWGGLALFALAGTTGALMRYWMLVGFPGWANFVNVRHAHSHLMYFGWVTPALMLLIAANLPAQTGKPVPGGVRAISGAALGTAGLAYLPFLLYGYELAPVLGKSLPLSVIASSLNILVWYAFALWYRKATRGVRRDRNRNPALRLWDGAVLFLLLASTGAWARGALMGMKVDDPFLGDAAVHLFLDLFSEGWLQLGLLGLVYAALPAIPAPDRWANRLLFAGLPLTFLLGVPIHLVPTALRLIAGVAGGMAALGVALHLWNIWKSAGQGGLRFWGLVLAIWAVKLAMLLGVSIPPLARWGETMVLRILYLHVFLLGTVTLGLLASAQQTWGKEAIASQTGFRVAVLALLASLIPLTGLWPQALGGRWRLAFAALAAWGPVVMALFSLVSASRRARWVMRTKGLQTGETDSVRIQ